jgi:anti-sigma factor RsiW
VQWLSKRLGKPLKVPKLSALGYELVGGRLLPGDIGARAQFMFQDAQGQRITLYLGAVDQKSEKMDPGETKFRYEADGQVPSFYWFDQGFGYALAGQVDREKLIALATLVHQQL